MLKQATSRRAVGPFEVTGTSMILVQILFVWMCSPMDPCWLALHPGHALRPELSITERRKK